MFSLFDLYQNFDSNIVSGKPDSTGLIDDYLEMYENFVCVTHGCIAKFYMLNNEAMECFEYTFKGRLCYDSQFDVFEKIIVKCGLLQNEMINFNNELRKLDRVVKIKSLIFSVELEIPYDVEKIALPPPRDVSASYEEESDDWADFIEKAIENSYLEDSDEEF